jgi:hypothetical protein
MQMARSTNKRKAQAAWDPIESLGGHGVWERETVVVSLANTAVTDDDLALFHDFPFVQILDLSRTAVGDKWLAHLTGLPALEELIVVDTKISKRGLALKQAKIPTSEALPVAYPRARTLLVLPCPGKAGDLSL